MQSIWTVGQSSGRGELRDERTQGRADARTDTHRHWGMSEGRSLWGEVLKGQARRDRTGQDRTGQDRTGSVRGSAAMPTTTGANSRARQTDPPRSQRRDLALRLRCDGVATFLAHSPSMTQPAQTNGRHTFHPSVASVVVHPSSLSDPIRPSGQLGAAITIRLDRVRALQSTRPALRDGERRFMAPSSWSAGVVVNIHIKRLPSGGGG